MLKYRNWIGIVDSAYPLQTRDGVEMIATGTNHVIVAEEICEAIHRAIRVRARILLDQEQDHLSETAAPEMENLRSRLPPLFADQKPSLLP